MKPRADAIAGEDAATQARRGARRRKRYEEHQLARRARKPVEEIFGWTKAMVHAAPAAG